MTPGTYPGLCLSTSTRCSQARRRASRGGIRCPIRRCSQRRWRPSGSQTSDTAVAYDDAGGVYRRATGVDAPSPRTCGGAARRRARGLGRAARDDLSGTAAGTVLAEAVAGRAARIARRCRRTPTNVVLDARDGARYRGEVEPVDARAGHIPGARSFPCRENLDDDGRLLGAAELRGRLAELGVDADTPVVSYCGSGVTACHNLLVLEHLGPRTRAPLPGLVVAVVRRPGPAGRDGRLSRRLSAAPAGPGGSTMSRPVGRSCSSSSSCQK